MSAPRPRLTHLIHLDGPGGGPQSTITQLTTLAGHFDQSAIYGGRGRIAAYCEEHKLPHYRVALDRKRILAFGIWQTWRKLRKIRPDVLVLHGQWGAVAGAIAGWFARVPYRVYIARWPAFYADWDLPRCIRNYLTEKITCRLTHQTVCLTESSRYQFLLRRLAPEKKLSVVPNAIPFDGAPDPARVEALRQRYHFDRYACNVISVGRLEQQKRNDWLIESWSRVAKAHPNAHLWIIGRGPKQAEWKQLSADLGVEDRVTWIEEQDFKGAEFIAAGDILAHTALFESFGNVVIEAMMAGKAIVATEVDGPRSIISNEVEGLLVRPGDTAAFADALCRLILDPATREKMGEAGKRSAHEYAPDRIAPRLLEAFSKRPRPLVTHIVHLDGPGGGPPLIIDMMRFLASSFDQNIIAGGRGRVAQYCERNGIAYHEIHPIRPSKWLRAGPVLWMKLRKIKPDAVILHGQPAGPVGALITKHLGIPTIYSAEWPAFYTDWDILRVVRNHLAEAIPCKLSDATIILSEGNYYQYLVRRLIIEERTTIIPNTISPHEALSESARMRVREEFGWNPDDCHVVTVARLTDQKRVDWLLRAWAIVCKAEPRAKLWVVGDGPEEEALQKLAEELRLTNCTFLGSPMRGAYFIAASDIVAMTTLYEGHARIPLEAMLNGKPIVANRADGVSNSFSNGVEGFLVPPANAELFAARLLELIRDPELRTRMGANGIERAKIYNPAVVFEKLRAVVANLIEKRP